MLLSISTSEDMQKLTWDEDFTSTVPDILKMVRRFVPYLVLTPFSQNV